MQFTPQQLAGGAKFSSTTRIGNWLEEIALKDAKQKEFHVRSQRGELSIQKQRKKLDICMTPVPHSYSEDGLLRFGDYILLKHDQTGTVLACDIFENVNGGLTEKFLVSNSYHTAPVARNIFKITRPPHILKTIDDNYDDDVLRIGCAFCLTCNDSLLISSHLDVLGPPLYLSSLKKNERSSASNSNRQFVFLTPTVNSDAAWVVTIPSLGRANASERYLSIGSPVYSGESIQINHRQTNMLLSCNPKYTEVSDFGNELETYADRSSGCGKLSLIQSEFKGLSTTYTLTKPDSPAFAWHFVTASSPDAAIDNRGLPPHADIPGLIRNIRSMLFAKDGEECFNKLKKKFRKVAADYNGKVDIEDLKTGLSQAGVVMENSYLDAVIDSVGVQEGLLDFSKFVEHLEKKRISYTYIVKYLECNSIYE